MVEGLLGTSFVVGAALEGGGVFSGPDTPLPVRLVLGAGDMDPHLNDMFGWL